MEAFTANNLEFMDIETPIALPSLPPTPAAIVPCAAEHATEPDDPLAQNLKRENQQLRLENQQLAEQVKRLVWVERQLTRSQDQMAQQVTRSRQLNELGKRYNQTFSVTEILDRSLEFILHTLVFERCIVFTRQPDNTLTALTWDGYYESAEVEPLRSLTLSLSQAMMSQILDKTLAYYCSANPLTPAEANLGQQLGMDEYFLFPLGGLGQQPRYILAIGNQQQAKYMSRVRPDSEILINLTQLISQATGAINQAELYQQAHQRAEELQAALQELQETQTQLIQGEKMSSLGQLVAGVAHEINNPVSFIYGNLNHADVYVRDLLRLLHLYQVHYPMPIATIQEEADAIDLDFLVEDLPKLMKSMQIGAERIQEIVHSLKTFSRMDEAEFKPVDIHEGIDSTLMILRHRLKAQPHRPEIHLIKEYGDLPNVQCFAGKLNQVFMNLIANAIDAIEEQLEKPDRNPQTKARLTIHTETVDSWAVIQICDSGTGISNEVKSKLFDPFFTTKPIGKGTGMGLSISYQIIKDKHRGLLECDSAIGQGTTFTIRIPIQQNLVTTIAPAQA
jgi:signal transduction histidine kinase